MSGINTSGELIRDAISLCNGIMQILSVSQKEMYRRYRDVGNDWSDSKYQQFGDIVNECSTAIKKTLNELVRCIVSLSDLQQSIAEYENISLIGGMPISDSVVNHDKNPQVLQVGMFGIYGGSYSDCIRYSTGLSGSEEIHHIPAKSVNGFGRNIGIGPAITMSKEDHKKTASYDNRRGSREYREKQRELIMQGRSKDAIQMDIDDIHYKFGDKYDNGINAALLYFEQLISEGIIR